MVAPSIVVQFDKKISDFFSKIFGAQCSVKMWEEDWDYRNYWSDPLSRNIVAV